MSTKPDALLNLADAMAEDILNTPDDEILREAKEDYGDPRALANKFDQILERTEKQVFGTARSAAFAPVRSSVLDLPTGLPDETIRRVKGIFDLGSRLSEFLSNLTPRTLAWSATAAAVAILAPAAVITAVVVKEQGPPSAQQMAQAPSILPRAGEKGDRLQMEAVFAPQEVVPSSAAPSVVPSSAAPTEVAGGIGGPRTHEDTQDLYAGQTMPLAVEATRKLSDEEIAALVAHGRQLIVAGDIPNARLVLQQAAEAGNATAALELGATYDPFILRETQDKQLSSQAGPTRVSAPRPRVSAPPPAAADIAMAKAWYEKARDLGSAEAAVRLERLTSAPSPRR
jgi:TPR repeat protein